MSEAPHTGSDNFQNVAMWQINRKQSTMRQWRQDCQKLPTTGSRQLPLNNLAPLSTVVVCYQKSTNFPDQAIGHVHPVRTVIYHLIQRDSLRTLQKNKTTQSSDRKKTVFFTTPNSRGVIFLKLIKKSNVFYRSFFSQANAISLLIIKSAINSAYPSENVLFALFFLNRLQSEIGEQDLL